MSRLLRSKEAIAVIAILLTAAFLRLYRIADYLTFLGDEGRDVLVVKGILEGNLVFLGPRMSAGDFFLGPIYYYMMAPFLWLTGLNPVGPAIMVGLLGVATVYMVYRIGKEFFSPAAGLSGAALYAVSSLVVIYSKSSWNPNAVPFFTILMLYLLYKAVRQDSWKLFVIVGFLFGILMQLHYIVVFLGLITILFVTFGNIFVVMKRKTALEKVRKIIIQGLFICTGFIIGMAPFLAFEIKNGFPNIRTITTFILGGTAGRETVSTPLYNIVSDVYIRVFGRLLTAFPPASDHKLYDPTLITIWVLVILLIAVSSIIALFRVKDLLIKLLLGTWLVVGILLFGFYRQTIYDYYFVLLYPLPFLLVGNLFSQLISNKRLGILGKVTAYGAVIMLLGINLLSSHHLKEPNRQMYQMQNIATFVLSKADPEPFNFALITGGNSDHAYRYFFSLEKRDPVTIENEINDPGRRTVTDQLLVICEDVSCGPLGHPLHEVAAFGRAEIEGEWGLTINKGEVSLTPAGEKPFVKVYKLRHFSSEEQRAEGEE